MEVYRISAFTPNDEHTNHKNRDKDIVLAKIQQNGGKIWNNLQEHFEIYHKYNLNAVNLLFAQNEQELSNSKAWE